MISRGLLQRLWFVKVTMSRPGMHCLLTSCIPKWSLPRLSAVLSARWCEVNAEKCYASGWMPMRSRSLQTSAVVTSTPWVASRLLMRSWKRGFLATSISCLTPSPLIRGLSLRPFLCLHSVTSLWLPTSSLRWRGRNRTSRRGLRHCRR